MHPCLKVPELLYTIFEFVNNGWFAGPHSLLNLALTCHTFNDVALDILWRSIPNIAILVKCFPDGVWKEKRDTNLVDIVSFTRDPSADEWTRFMSYAARVKNLCRGETSPFGLAMGLDTTRVEGSVYSTIYRLREGKQIFPNLRRFEWYHESDDVESELAYLRLLLGPKVNNILAHSLKPLEAPFCDEFCGILEEFGKRAPPMVRISAICPLTPKLAATISSMVVTQYHLRSLHIFQDHFSSMSLDAALHLARLPSLETLCLRPDRIEDSNGRPRSLTEFVSDPFFPSIQSLTLYADDLSALLPFLAHIQSKSLTMLQVVTVDSPTGKEVQSFHKILQAHPGISHIICSSGCSSPRYDASYCVTSHHLRPLLSLKGMVHCKLQWKCVLHLDDYFVEEIAKAWPRLHVLDLCGEWRREPDTVQVTLKGIMALAKHCRRLQHLGMVFDTGLAEFAETDPEDRPGGGICSENLYTLNAGTSRIMEAREMVKLASVLSDIFPHLLYISSSWGRRDSPDIEGEDEDEDEESKLWDQLQRLCREMGRVRRQERRWFAQLPGHEAVLEYKPGTA